MRKINVFGSTILDINFELSKKFLHRYLRQAQIDLPFGEKLTAENYEIMIGGSGANVAVGLSRQGYQVKLFTSITDDGIGRFLKESLETENVKVITQKTPNKPDLSLILRVSGERTILTGHNPDDSFEDIDVPSSGWLHFGPVHGEGEEIYRQGYKTATKTDQKISLNPSIDSIEHRSKDLLLLLQNTEILFVNKKEAQALSRLRTTAAPLEMAQTISRLGVRVVCVTLAENGAIVLSDNDGFFSPALVDRATRVDATGAGDAFASGFLGGYFYGEEKGLERNSIVKLAISCASANATSAVSEVGGQSGLLNSHQLLLKSTHAKVKPL